MAAHGLSDTVGFRYLPRRHRAVDARMASPGLRAYAVVQNGAASPPSSCAILSYGARRASFRRHRPIAHNTSKGLFGARHPCACQTLRLVNRLCNSMGVMGNVPQFAAYPAFRQLEQSSRGRKAPWGFASLSARLTFANAPIYVGSTISSVDYKSLLSSSPLVPRLARHNLETILSEPFFQQGSSKLLR